MATAREILLSEDTDRTLVIDLDRRIIDIPPAVKLLGVESDKKVKRLNFRVPATYRDIDLSSFDIQINYFNAKMQGDVYIVDDKAVEDGYITFSWEVDAFAFKYKGSVKFIACFKLSDENGELQRELNTTPASLPVHEGLETAETVAVQNPAILELLLLRVTRLENFGTVTDEQIAAAVDNYLTLHPIEGVTDEQIAAAVDNYLTLYPIEGVTDDEIAAAVASYLTANPPEAGTVSDEQIAEAIAKYFENNPPDDSQNGCSCQSVYEYAVACGYEGEDEDTFKARFLELLSGTAVAVVPFDGSNVSVDDGASIFIDGISYGAKEGMTWAEWLASDYNTLGLSNYSLYIGGPEMTALTGFMTLLPVVPTDVIEFGGMYVLTPISELSSLESLGGEE